MRREELHRCIVRILDAEGVTIGAGFVVSADGLIVTCAHVIVDAGGGPCETVAIAFEGATTDPGPCTAHVIPEFWRDPRERDIAILKFEGEPPEGVLVAPLGPSVGTEQHAVYAVGFPRVTRPSEEGGESARPRSIAGDGVVVATIQRVPPAEFGTDIHPVLQLRSVEITAGFSGGPLFDVTRQRVIGIVDSILAPDEATRLRDSAFATPAETIRAVCQALEVSSVCPFQGLASFTEAQAAYFFGRQRVTDKLTESLRREPRWLLVLGPSGSGKSSAVHAGLVPMLRRGGVPGSEKWTLVMARPTNAPLAQLERAGLSGAVAGLSAAVEIWVAQNPAPRRLVLVLDQFEELLVTCPPEARRSFIHELCQMLEGPSPVSLVLVIRNDFYGQLAEEAPALLELVEEGVRNVLQTLRREEVEAIVRAPATAVGLALEDDLVAALHDDIMAAAPHHEAEEEHARSTALPLLQFALTEVWRRDHIGGELTLQSYRALGGLAGALVQWADGALRELQQAGLEPIARRVLTALVHLGDEARGVPDSRRRRERTELPRSPDERLAVDRVIDVLSGARLLVTDEAKDEARGTVELIHDALIREWGRLQRWVREDREFLSWQQEVEPRKAAWVESAPGDAGRRDVERLLRGRELAVAEGWLRERPRELGESERAFVDASLGQRDAEQTAKSRRRFATIALLVAALVVVLVGALLVFREYRRAERSTALAQRREREAEASARRARESEADLRRTALERNSLTAAASARIEGEGQVVAFESAIRVLGDPLLRDPRTDLGQMLVRLGEASEAQLPRMQLTGHTSYILHVAWSPDGRTIATGSGDGTARLWDAQSGREQFVLRPPPEAPRPGHGTGERNSAVTRVVFSPDSSLLATSATTGKVRLWDARRGVLLHDLPGHEDIVRAVAFSQDGALLVSGGLDKTARIWDVRSGALRHVLRGHQEWVRSVEFSPNGRLVVTAGEDNTARIWDVGRGTLVRVLSGHAWPVEVATFSVDGSSVLTVSRDGTARLWAAATGALITVLRGHHGPVIRAAFSPDGQTLVTSGIDRTARTWDARTGAPLVTLAGHDGPISSVAYSSDGARIVTAGEDRTARLWDARTGALQVKLREHEGSIGRAVFSPDGTQVLTHDEGNVARIWDAHPRPLHATLHADGDDITAALFSPNGERIVTVTDGILRIWDAQEMVVRSTIDEPGAVLMEAALAPDSVHLVANGFLDRSPRIWNLRTRSLERLLPREETFRNESDWSPDGRYIATASDSAVHLWNAADGTPFRTIELGAHGAEYLRFAPSGAEIFIANMDSSASGLWDVRTGARRFSFGRPTPGWNGAFSPDGIRLVTSGRDGTLQSYDARDGTPREIFRGALGNVSSVAFSRDGTRVAAASDDNTVRVWDARSQDLLFTLREHLGPVKTVAFSPDGMRILTAARDQTARMITIDLEHYRRYFCDGLRAHPRWNAPENADVRATCARPVPPTASPHHAP